MDNNRNVGGFQCNHRPVAFFAFFINVNTSSHGTKLDLERLQTVVNVDIKWLIFSWFHQFLESKAKWAEICSTAERLQTFEQWKVML